MICQAEAPSVNWRCRLFGHKPEWTSFDIARAQSKRRGHCERCDLPLFQHTGSRSDIVVDWSRPCTHGVGGVPTLCCMTCAVERQNYEHTGRYPSASDEQEDQR